MLGEDLACEHLLQKGYEIIERNWRFGKYEIDLIARSADRLVFVEVKARQSVFFTEPEFAVNLRKQQRIIAAANHFIREREITTEARFDIVSIIILDGGNVIRHIEGAFFPRVK